MAFVNRIPAIQIAAVAAAKIRNKYGLAIDEKSIK